jgi:hypothetical protein
MNFRRTRNKRRCHGSAAHLASVADRIDRSYSPRGGREERELDVSSFKLRSKNDAASSHIQNVYSQVNAWRGCFFQLTLP